MSDKNKKIKVTQINSSISCSVNQKKSLKGLGLNKISSTKVLENTDSIQGMINKVKHLVCVEIV